MAEHPPVDVARFGQSLGRRLRAAPTPFGYAIVDAVGMVATTGESVVQLTVGDPPNKITYPSVRFAETPTPLAPGDKVLLVWIGTNPFVLAKLVP